MTYTEAIERCESQCTCEPTGWDKNSDALRIVLSEIKRLRAAALRLMRDGSRVCWGWNPDAQLKGYFLDGKWCGETLDDVLTAEAIKGE